MYMLNIQLYYRALLVQRALLHLSCNLPIIIALYRSEHFWIRTIFVTCQTAKFSEIFGAAIFLEIHDPTENRLVLFADNFARDSTRLGRNRFA